MPGADDWRDIPNGILDQDKRAQEAQQWGAQARAELAAEWASQARAEVPGFGFDPSNPSSLMPPPVLDQDVTPESLMTWQARQRKHATEIGNTDSFDLVYRPGLNDFGPYDQFKPPDTTVAPQRTSGDYSPSLVPGAGSEAATPSQPSPPFSTPTVAPAPEPLRLDAPLPTPSQRSSLNDISQFGQEGVSYSDALAACGPAAAARLASIFGNTIPLKAVLDVAKQVGWTQGGGMNGVQNQKRLLDTLGIPSSLDLNPDPSHIISDAQSGNPVTLSTPNHYFTVDGFDASTGKYHVGQSGLAYRGGSEWMTMDQIRRIGGGLNGALFVDAPTSPRPSLAALNQPEGAGYVYGSQPVAAGGATSTVPPTAPQSSISFDGLVKQAQDAVGGAVQAVTNAPAAAQQTFNDVVNQARQAVGYLPDQAGQAVGGFLSDVAGDVGSGLLEQGTENRRTVEQAGQFTQAANENLSRQQAERPPLSALTPAGVPDVGQAVTEGLNRAGIPEARFQIGPVDVGSNALLGFGAGMVQPTGAEGKVAGLAGKAGREAEQVVAHGLTINLPKYIPEEVQNVIRQAYDANPALFDEARRGVISDDTVRQLAEQVGRSPSQIAALWKPGQAKNAETILALREGLNAASQDVLQAQNVLRENPTSADALNAVTAALTKHAAIQEAVTGVTAEAGRALRQFRQPVTGQQFALQQLQRIAKSVKMTPEELASNIANIDLSDPNKVASLARTLTTHSFGDKLSALWYFSLLSSPVTHIKNTLSNALVTASRPIETAVSATVDLPLSRLQRRGRERFFGEAPAQVVGMTAGLRDGLRSAYQILRQGFTEGELSAKPELAGKEPFSGRFADLTVNVPGRALRASDVFFRTLNKSASIYSDAYRLASQEGLKGQALLDKAAQLVANPTSEMLERAEREGAYRVFQQDGTFVRRVAEARSDLPALRYLVPFVQTPYNIAKYALERSPLALGKIASEAVTPSGRASLATKGGGDLSDRLARVAMGSATLYTLVQYARDGNLTGQAPRDPAEKDAFYRQGRQPYSIKNPVTGQWMSYAGLQPFTTIFAAAAQIEDMQRGKPGQPAVDPLTGIAVTALALGRATLDQPWTDGLSEFLDFMSGANVNDAQDLLDSAGKYAAGQSRVLVPAVVRWLATANDPTIRQPEAGLSGIPQTIESGIPGLSGNVPARQTAFGQPAPRQNTGLASLNPLYAPQPNADPVERELARLQLKGYDVQPGFVGKSFQVGTEQVALDQGERRQYQEAAGTLVYELLSTAMESREWAGLNDVGKAKTVERLVQRAREAARTQLSQQPAIRQRAIDSRQKRLASVP